MSAASRQIVHDAVNAICNCEVGHYAAPNNLPTHFMDLAHALLPRVQGCAASCCTLADLLTAAYQLGMSRALASVAAGLEGDRPQQYPDIVPDGYCP
jgi:hypothetical protein